MKRKLILAVVAALTISSFGCTSSGMPSCNWLFRRGASVDQYPPMICQPVQCCDPCAAQQGMTPGMSNMPGSDAYNMQSMPGPGG